MTEDFAQGDVVVFPMKMLHGSVTNQTPQTMRLSCDVRDTRPRLMLLWFSRPWQDLGVVGLQVRYQPASHAHDDRYSVGANDAEQAAANRSRLSVRDSSLLKSHAAFKNRSTEALCSWQVKSAARGFVDVLDAKQKERSMAAAREEWGIPPPARL